MILILFQKIKLSILSILEDIYLFFFSINKKKFINNQLKILIEIYKKKKLNHWEHITYLVLKKISRFGFHNFLRFRLIRDTMFVNDENNFNKYLDLIDLKKDFNFLKEDLFGNPILSKQAPFTSINKLHQLYHLKLFKKLSKGKYSNVCLELGGGYGLLCMLSIKYLKVKKYIIYDLEGFLYIQKIYLKNVLSDEEFSKIKFINEIDILKKELARIKKFNFFAFWSFSELNIKLRKNFIPFIVKSNFFFIGYQDYFLKLNNNKYFKDFIKKLNNFTIVKKKSLLAINNYYLFGNK